MIRLGKLHSQEWMYKLKYVLEMYFEVPTSAPFSQQGTDLYKYLLYERETLQIDLLLK